MADSQRALLRVRLGYEDHEWLAKLAQDEAVSIHVLVKRAVRHFRYWKEEGEETLTKALDIFEVERSSHQDERRRRQYFQREYELESLRLRKQLHDERNLRAKSEQQLRDERNLRAKTEKQLRDERNLRAKSEKQLHDERNLRAKSEQQLHDERNLRAKTEQQLHDERDYYERQARAAETYRNVLFSPTVAKLLTLAIRSESDAEAMTAVAKARALNRKEKF